MILFDFQCRKCEHIWEEGISSAEAKLPRCPLCNGKSDKVFTKGFSKHLSWSSWATDLNMNSNPNK
jgi:putative FmdB family regulatory protein